jgi:hypothetical protein
LVELVRTKNVHEASVLRLGPCNAPEAARSRKWMRSQFFEENGETAIAISPDHGDQALKFRVAGRPHPEEPRNNVSKDE